MAIEFDLMGIDFGDAGIDVLDISGQANLDGVLEFTFTGFDIMAGTFNFLNFDSHAGQFDHIILPSFEGFNLDVAFDDRSANLVITDESVSAVPVPTALLLFGPALLGLLGLRHRANIMPDGG